ncbi:MAG: hypothetical protein AAGA20_12945, partial [Planctomycetota bacterium]
SDGDVVLLGGEMLEGERVCESFTLPRGVIAYARADLRVVAKGPISIEGTLVCLPSESGADGPHVFLRSATSVAVTGFVHGAPGRSYDAEPDGALGVPGGGGSNIVIEAPEVGVSGTIVAGNGGCAGRGGRGGQGGSVLAIGIPMDIGDLGPPSYGRASISGAGGPAGPADRRVDGGKPAVGGNGGSAGSFRTRDQVPDGLRALLD